MNTTRPTNPADISFDDRCFAQDGVKVEWVVGGNMAPNYPQVLHVVAVYFSTEDAAMAYARKTAPRLVRVSWT